MKLRFIRKIRTLKFLAVLMTMISKNIKMIVRSKTSALIVLLGPLFITLLVGTAFNTTSLYDLKIGTYSSSYSTLTESLLSELGSKEFKVIKTPTEADCIQSLKIGENHVCAVFPPDLKVGTAEEIKFYVDESRMNLVWIIIETISKRVSTKSNELSLQLTTVILNTLDDTSKQIEEKSGVISGALTENQQAVSKVSELRTSLNSLNLNFVASDLQLVEIRKKLNDVITAQNLSSSIFDSVKASIDYSINKSVSVQQQFTNASDTLTQSTLGLEDVSSSLNTQQSNIQSVQSSLTSIKDTISKIEVKDAGTIVNPIKTSVNTITKDTTHLNYLFPTLVILVIMFISLLLSSTLVIREKTSSAYFRNFISPSSDAMFILGDYLTNIIILLLQLVVVFGVAAFFFKEALVAVLGNSLLLVFIIASVFIMAGMLIGYIFKSEETSTLGAISIGSILLFFSNTILPIESLPETLRKFIDFNPFMLAESVLKKLMLFNTELIAVVEPIGTLVLMFIVLTLCVYGARKLTKRVA